MLSENQDLNEVIIGFRTVSSAEPLSYFELFSTSSEDTEICVVQGLVFLQFLNFMGLFSYHEDAMRLNWMRKNEENLQRAVYKPYRFIFNGS